MRDFYYTDKNNKMKMKPYKNKRNPKMSSIARKLNIVDLLGVYK